MVRWPLWWAALGGKAVRANHRGLLEMATEVAAEVAFRSGLRQRRLEERALSIHERSEDSVRCRTIFDFI